MMDLTACQLCLVQQTTRFFYGRLQVQAKAKGIERRRPGPVLAAGSSTEATSCSGYALFRMPNPA